MRKKRILFCTEATFLNTGYATYSREILNYLNKTGKYELAELASYGKRNDPRAKDIAWKFYGVVPPDDAPESEHERYNAMPVNQFGEFAFESVCLDFKPDIVCDIRDFWMVDFAERSPYRKNFHWCLMPTVDAAPQARQWISTFQSADTCLTYSDWAGNILSEQSGNQINYLGSAPPSAHAAYQPMDKAATRAELGLPLDEKIIGTVMRNQRRKLYPDLFAAFKLFQQDRWQGKDYKLYCHTSYPDLGWNIPELLQQYGLSSSVYFTYVCQDTNKPFASLFKGSKAQSPFTGTLNAVLSNVKVGLSYEDLAKVMNSFDLYVQYANSEGFGLPQVEAAACGVPVMSTDYSAMESVVRKLEGVPLKLAAKYKELETGCYRAVPDNHNTAKEFATFFNKSDEERRQIGDRTRELFLEHFRWEQSGAKWEECFDQCPIRPMEETWLSEPDIQKPADKPEKLPEKSTAQSLARWLIVEVLRRPDLINSHMEARMCRDLTYNTVTATTGGVYQNEASAAFDAKASVRPFDFDMAYTHMVNMRNKINYWEDQRRKVLSK